MFMFNIDLFSKRKSCEAFEQKKRTGKRKQND